MRRPLLLALMVLFGCSAAPLRPEVRLEASDPASIDAFVAERLRADGLIGLSVAVAHDGELRLARGYGSASAFAAVPVDESTRFGIGSVTKQFVAACVLLLAEDGRLSLDDPVSRYFPDLTRAGDITLRHLLQHLSGYPDYYPLDIVDARTAEPISPDELVRRYASLPLEFEPGSRFSYSNTGYVILGRVVEMVSGEPFGTFLERRILTPLGLTHTSWSPDPAGAGLALGHTRFALGPPEPQEPDAAGWLTTAGGMWSTAADLVRWDLALASGEVLSPASFRVMTTPAQLTGGATTGYGCGVLLENRGPHLVIGHDGGVPGFVAMNFLVPSSGTAIAVLSNSLDFETYFAVYGLARELLEALAPPTTPAVAGPPAADAARALFGQLQRGAIDRRTLGPEYAAFLTDERLAAAAERLAGWGEPSGASVLESWERGGMEFALVRLQFPDGRALRAVLARTPDGTIAEFLVSR